MDNNLHRFRKLILYVGMPRGGKSYMNLQYMRKYTQMGGGAIVYNYGKEKDFPDENFTLITPLAIKEHLVEMRRKGISKEDITIYKTNPELTHFRAGRSGEILHFKDFNEFFTLKRKMCKMKMIHDRTEENCFFRTVANYISNNYFFVDDCHVTLKYFNSRHTQLFARMNHSGDKSTVVQLRGVGCDGGLAYHNFDRVRDELIDYITDVVLFKQINVPDANQVQDVWLKKTIIECSKYLNEKAPQFSALHIDVNARTVNNATLKQ
jgi:hypothetical protein